MIDRQRVIIVEGLSDKKHLQKIIKEEMDIICTNGTFSYQKFDELLEEYDLDDRALFILVDEDRPGKKLRKELARELPHAEHIYIDPVYVEVADVPLDVLSELLERHRIRVTIEERK